MLFWGCGLVLSKPQRVVYHVYAQHWQRFRAFSTEIHLGPFVLIHLEAILSSVLVNNSEFPNNTGRKSLIDFVNFSCLLRFTPHLFSRACHVSTKPLFFLKLTIFFVGPICTCRAPSMLSRQPLFFDLFSSITNPMDKHNDVFRVYHTKVH